MGLFPSDRNAVAAVDDPRTGSVLVQETQFDVVIVEYSDDEQGVRDLIRNLRWSGAPCKNAVSLLMCRPEDLDQAEARYHAGFSRILNSEAPDSVLIRAFDELLTQETRRPVHALVRIEGQDLGLNSTFMAQTTNLSASGMLVRFDKEVTIGTEFGVTLEIPKVGQPIKCRATVVRLAPGGERPTGFAARFIRFEGEGEEQLRTFLTAYRPPVKKSKA